MVAENNVQLHVRINSVLKKKLLLIQVAEGYKSMDRTVREVIRKVDELHKVKSEVRDLKRLVRSQEANLDDIKDIIMGFQEYKLRQKDWHPGLIEVEKSLLEDYLEHLSEKYIDVDVEEDSEGEEEEDD